MRQGEDRGRNLRDGTRDAEGGERGIVTNVTKASSPRHRGDDRGHVVDQAFTSGSGEGAADPTP
jgi:hypothetical protein